jgi:hypothetical protein
LIVPEPSPAQRGRVQSSRTRDSVRAFPKQGGGSKSLGPVAAPKPSPAGWQVQRYRTRDTIRTHFNKEVRSRAVRHIIISESTLNVTLVDYF